MNSKNQAHEILGLLKYVGPDTEGNLHFFVKKDRWESIEKMSKELKHLVGKEVIIIIKKRGDRIG